jgi:hypothetical protein
LGCESHRSSDPLHARCAMGGCCCLATPPGGEVRAKRQARSGKLLLRSCGASRTPLLLLLALLLLRPCAPPPPVRSSVSVDSGSSSEVEELRTSLADMRAVAEEAGRRTLVGGVVVVAARGMRARAGDFGGGGGHIHCVRPHTQAGRGNRDAGGEEGRGENGGNFTFIQHMVISFYCAAYQTRAHQPRLSLFTIPNTSSLHYIRRAWDSLAPHSNQARVS